MKRRNFISVAALAAAALASTGVASAAQAAPKKKRTASTVLNLPQGAETGISRAQIFDSLVPDPSVYAGKNVAYIWGSGSPTPPAGTVSSRYLPLVRDFGWTVRPLTWWQANHPDWVLYLADGVTPAYLGTGKSVPLDMDNPLVREWYWDNQVQPAIDQGYTLIALDNVVPWNWLHAKGRYDATGAWVDMYTGDLDDPAYTTTVLNWLKYLVNRLHSVGIAAAGNVSPLGVNPYQRTASAAAVNLVDLWLHEGGFTRSRDANIADDEWSQTFQLYRSVVATKPVVDISMTTTPHLADANQAQVDWIIANYFLVRERDTLLTLAGRNEYGMFLDRSELYLNIGKAMCDPELTASGAWQRCYQQGLVLVNPSSTLTATVTLPTGNWVDTHGTPYTGTITLPTVSGAVLTRV
ncbi:hypothetical protein AB0M47_03980 [Hamadaea sp. NPDC051192]|uniref:hypothetical protein n=1 Tax=Hamadaea sp. NPDC051192 TaxID=3154940 RepID=UPI0034194149